MKKLLILGGNALSAEIIKAAKELNVYTIVTDWYDTQISPAKLLADEYWDISITDYDKLVNRIKSEGINGIITGFTDSYLLPYQYLCELTGLPCYSTKEIFEITLDKSKFKKLCRENGVPTVPEYCLTTFNPATISEKESIIIKPVDNSGSRGICRCSDSSEFDACLKYSLSFSQKKEVVIEKYMDMDTFSTSYTIQEGVISTSTMNDRIVHKVPDGGAVTCGGVYPSRYLDVYMSDMDKRVKTMFKNLGMKNGVLFIQGFTNGKEFYFYEMGYRLSGGRHFIFTENQNNSSSAKQLVYFAINGKMADYSIEKRDTPYFKDLCYQINVLGKEGKINKIEGFEYLQSIPEIIQISLLKNEGDTIGKNGTTAQHILGMHMVVKSKERFKELLSEITYHFKVLDEYGNDLKLEILK